MPKSKTRSNRVTRRRAVLLYWFLKPFFSAIIFFEPLSSQKSQFPVFMISVSEILSSFVIWKFVVRSWLEIFHILSFLSRILWFVKFVASLELEICVCSTTHWRPPPAAPPPWCLRNLALSRDFLCQITQQSECPNKLFGIIWPK